MFNATRGFNHQVYATISVGSAIDFCVWVLEKDGLHVPPFDKHPDGDGSLRARGMTAESWRDWTQKTALLWDQRLGWEEKSADDREAVIEFYEQCKAAQKPGSSFPHVEHAQLLEHFDQQCDWQRAQREKIEGIVKQVYGSRTPPDAWEDEISVWEGNPAVAERLYELYDEHPHRERDEVWLDFKFDAEGRMVGPIAAIVKFDAAFRSIDAELAQYDGASIHLVSYPHPVELALLPGALILSQSSEPRNQQMFDDRVKKAIRQLVALHRSEADL